MYDKLVKKVNAIQAVNPSNFCQKNLIWQKKKKKKKKKLKRKLLIIIIIISVLQHKNVISQLQKILLQD